MTTVTVMDWQRVLVYLDGKLDRVCEPGRHRVPKRRAHLITVDVRPDQLQVTGQELITADGVSVRLSLSALWRVTDPVAYTVESQNPLGQLYSAVQDAARDRVGGLTLAGMIADREALSTGLTDIIGATVGELGISVDRVRVRDLMLPGELRRAAMDTVIAKERGKAALEAARAETAALRALKNTAAMLEEHPALLRLRTLQLVAESGASVVLDPRAGGDGPRD